MAVVKERLSILRQKMQLLSQTTTDRNTLYLYIEVIFAGILAAAGAFNSAYILRAGGSKTLVGLLSSLPSLVAVFTFMPSARILERKTHYGPWVVGSLFLARVGYVFIMALPFLGISYLPEITVALLVAMTIPSVFFSTGWSPLLSDVVPARSRANVLAWRSILSSATIAPLTYLAGKWLDYAPFPGNYQWLYGIGFLAGAISVYFCSRIRITASSEKPTPATETQKQPWIAALRTAARENPRFLRIIINTFMFDFSAWMVGPLYIIFFVQNLNATDSWIGLHTSLAHIGVVVGYWIWRRIIYRIGEAKALLIALPLATTYAFMVALVPNLTFILFAGFLINVFNPGVGLSHGVIFLDLLPQGKKHGATAMYSMVMHVGAFTAPLIGVAVSNRIGIVPTLLIGGTMRFLGALLFYIFPVKGERQKIGLPHAIILPRMFGGTRK